LPSPSHAIHAAAGSSIALYTATMPILSVKDLRQAPGYLFRRAFQLSVAIATEQLATHNLTTVQFASLVGIHEHPGLDATRLSALIKFDKATLTGEIDVSRPRR